MNASSEMNPVMRWVRFNVVGAMGMVVQLSVLAGLNWLLPGHYLAATAVAIEVAVLHNFVWHVRYTWRDRNRGEGDGLRRLVRFHVSNGAISMIGNLALMRVLVQHAGMRPVAANVVAIGCCSVANFVVGNLWAFGDRKESELETQG
jgi:putative flippase GtrA